MYGSSSLSSWEWLDAEEESEACDCVSSSSLSGISRTSPNEATEEVSEWEDASISILLWEDARCAVGKERGWCTRTRR